ncbi:MAG: tryptophan 7-halogenase [Myxococcales bacterium]|nr:tryptophan 7-halogenase [Myxococcales bacterium]
MEAKRAEVVIVGAGPGGTTAATFLARRGVQVTLLEKDEFPRFHIGESMTGCCGEVVRQLGLTEHMETQRHPTKLGTRVYGPDGLSTFWVPVMSRSESGELVDAETWQVRRSDFDRAMLDAARQAGVSIVKGRATGVLRGPDDAIAGVIARDPDGAAVELPAAVVVDASGQGTFLANAGVTGPKSRGRYDRQLAVYSHVRGALRDEGAAGGNTLIFYEKTHHWAWFIPLDDDVVSVGVVVPSEYYKSSGLDTRGFYQREIGRVNPELARRLEAAELVEDVRTSSNYSYRVDGFTGRNFLCIGDAHRFVDPIFSFGLFFAMVEGQLAAEHITRYLSGERGGEANPFAEFEVLAERGMDAVEDAVDCFWHNPFAFAYLVHHKYREDMIDLFAGRIYEEQPSRGLQAIRVALRTALENDGAALGVSA